MTRWNSDAESRLFHAALSIYKIIQLDNLPFVVVISKQGVRVLKEGEQTQSETREELTPKVT